MFAETKKSTSVEVTHKIGVTLTARCSDSDCLYEIDSLKQTIDSSSLPIRQTIEFIVTMRSAENPKDFLTFYSQIEGLEVRLDFYSVPIYYVSLIDTNISDIEVKENMLRSFRNYSAFNLEFSIES